jgi:hypothetical protein
VLGYPIRTPSDHSSVDNSPRTIAASHVLHRLLMPRHPPCALQHFTTQHINNPQPATQPNRARPQTTKTRHNKMLASTMQHSTHHHTPTHHNHHHTHPPTQGNTGDALDGPGRERPPEKTHPTRRRCLLRTQQHAEPTNLFVFHPATPPTNQQKGMKTSRKRKPTPPPPQKRGSGVTGTLPTREAP